jgi:hypothetical protein
MERRLSSNRRLEPAVQEATPLVTLFETITIFRILLSPVGQMPAFMELGDAQGLRALSAALLEDARRSRIARFWPQTAAAPSAARKSACPEPHSAAISARIGPVTQHIWEVPVCSIGGVSMVSHRGHRISIAFAITLSATACGNPYGLKISSANYDAAPLEGKISFTDPKLYRREALINERREERTYLGNLIAASAKLDDSGVPKLQFAPQIVRQLEVITTLSASLGLKFDPAAGRANLRAEAASQRADETTDIQHQMDVLRLQMQLDKLKRDAALLPDELAKQTTPTAPATGTPTPTPTPTASGTTVVTPTSVASLVASVDALKAALTTLLDGKDHFAALVPSDKITADPFDSFSDRSAYREMLNGALNAASLDELHDADGAALIRLNMTATVFPPRSSHRASFGQLAMEVSPPNTDKNTPEIAGLYRDWLLRINEQLAQPHWDSSKAIDSFDISSIGYALSQNSDLFDILWYEFSKDKRTGCRGVVLDGTAIDGCLKVPVAVPRIAIDLAAASYDLSPADVLKRFSNDVPIDYASLFDNLAQSGTLSNFYGEKCLNDPLLLQAKTQLNGIPDDQLPSNADTISLAFALDELMRSASTVELQGRAIARRNKLSVSLNGPLNSILVQRGAKARAVVNAIRKSASSHACDANFKRLTSGKVPDSFLSSLNFGHAAVYQVGPKQQVQIVSTAARAAEAISLAATVAAQAPGSGMGADAAASFGRNAVGKVDALERVPLVVAYGDSRGDGNTNSAAFGWMMGPRTLLDPAKQALILEQGLRSQDLSVDLIVPGWWPYLWIKSRSSWSPAWAGSRHGTSGARFVPNEIKVQLSPSGNDLDQITSHIIGGSSLKLASLDSVTPNKIGICATNLVLQLRGSQVWRADKVVIGGRIFKGDDISVLPDMAGLLVTISAADFPVFDSATGALRQATITALTPYGPAPIELTVEGQASECPKQPTPAQPK